MTTTLKFIDTPPEPARTGARGRWNEVGDELRAHAGLWAEVITAGTDSQAGSAYSALRKQGCEVKRRQTSDGVYVFARWPE